MLDRNTDMIEGYKRSCKLVKERIDELSALKKSLIRSGKHLEAEELMLDRRIFLLYTEHKDMQEVIGILSDYTHREG